MFDTVCSTYESTMGAVCEVGDMFMACLPPVKHLVVHPVGSGVRVVCVVCYVRVVCYVFVVCVVYVVL